MRRTARTLLTGAIVGLFFTPPGSAQTLDDICPGAEEGTGALWGAVVDTLAGMVLPGATVVASWSDDGEDRRAEASVGVDGSYTMCYLPLATSVSVYASFANLTGDMLAVSLGEVFTRQDFGLSMSRTGGGDDRLWLCVDGGQSIINIQYSRLLRCDENWQPLERCPKEELGQITVHPAGAGSGMLREMIEKLVQEAERIGANAIVNVRDGRGGTSFGGARHAMSIIGEGVRIEVDPSTCR